jgi:protein gp37
VTRNRSTGIEWTEHTWNPFVGCSIHTAGCTNCYAMRLAARIEAFGTTPAYAGTTRIANGHPVWSGRINRSSPATWRKPLSVRAPSKFFVNSMSDFFHEDAPDEWRADAIDIMRATPRHQYQVLTKRIELVAPFLDRTGLELPPNFWMGVTVERADMTHRLDTLRELPARIRFVSAEPLLGPIERLDLAGIDWVITGGESGPRARPMRIEWVRSIRDQCLAAGVAFFHKQYGLARNNPLANEAPAECSAAAWVKQVDPLGKGGALVDGVLWRQFPI